MLMDSWHVRHFLILIPILFGFLVGVYALFRCRGDKRNYFILLTFTAFLHILGYYLGIISPNTISSGMYLASFGGGLCAFANVLFVAEYCEVKLPAAAKAVLCTGTFLYILAVCTAGVTSYYGQSLGESIRTENPLTNAADILPWVVTLYYAVYIVIALTILLRKLISSYGGLRKILICILVAILVPVAASVMEAFISLAYSAMQQFFITPYAYGVSAIVCLIAIKRYDMLSKAPLPSMQAIYTIPQAVVLLDDKLHYIMSNVAAAEVFPWLKDYKTDEAIIYSPHWPAELSHTAFNKGAFSVEFAVMTNGSVRHYNASVHPFNSEISNKSHWYIIISDITDKEVFIRQLEEAAYTDTLTGLYNRRHFAEIATPYIERTKRAGLSYYIMMADLDFFKRINDEHGHLAGDSVLRHTAMIMKTIVRSYDIVARWGGEEFIFLITDSSAADVFQLAERIRQTIEKTPSKYNGMELPITISFGIAQCQTGQTEMEELILRADEALYSSKQNGRNRVTFWKVDG